MNENAASRAIAIRMPSSRRGNACGTGAPNSTGGGNRGQRGLVERVGRAVESRIQIVDLVCLVQAEVAIGQRDFIAGRDVSAPAQSGRQRFFEHLRVPRRADAIREHAVKRHLRPEVREAERDRAEGLRHGLRGDHREHRHAEGGREIGAARRAVEQTHHAFDQDQIGFGRRLREQIAARGFADHPQIERQHRRAARALEDHRVEKVRTGLEDAHAPPQPPVIARETRGDRGLALARSGGADEQGGAGATSLRTPRRAALSRLARDTDA